uniref:Uncharacterized protein n=1 Tax=Arundo donax TaxID=35708 RepID=A0A0A9BYG6_ARUDO
MRTPLAGASRPPWCSHRGGPTAALAPPPPPPSRQAPATEAANASGSTPRTPRAPARTPSRSPPLWHASIVEADNGVEEPHCGSAQPVGEEESA